MARHFIKLVLDNSLLLVAGTIVALVWANVDPASYERLTNPLRFFVNDIGMVFFFALAAKEVFEAMLPGGALAARGRAIPPLAAAVGGMVLPAGIYVTLALSFQTPELLRGWAIPCATDIAFSAMIARMIFPAAHPAIPFLLLLAIADDAFGLVILAIFYSSDSVSFAALAVLLNAGVPLERIGAGTYYVLTALLVGKPVGILLFSLGTRLIGASLPQGLHIRDLVLVGFVAAIGFTVSMFFAIAAFPEGSALAETKMGALLSFVAAPLAIAVGRLSADRSKPSATSRLLPPRG